MRPFLLRFSIRGGPTLHYAADLRVPSGKRGEEVTHRAGNAASNAIYEHTLHTYGVSRTCDLLGRFAESVPFHSLDGVSIQCPTGVGLTGSKYLFYRILETFVASDAAAWKDN
jgi:hypothetical protein